MLRLRESSLYPAHDLGGVGAGHDAEEDSSVSTEAAAFQKQEDSPQKSRRAPRVRAVDRSVLVILLCATVLATGWWYYQMASFAHRIIVSAF